MAVNVEALGIDRMSVAERLALIEAIWESLPEQVAVPEVPAWHLAELARWRVDVEANPGTGREWREVLGEMEPDL